MFAPTDSLLSSLRTFVGLKFPRNGAEFPPRRRSDRAEFEPLLQLMQFVQSDFLLSSSIGGGRTVCHRGIRSACKEHALIRKIFSDQIFFDNAVCVDERWLVFDQAGSH